MYYDRIDLSEETDLNNDSKEFIICYHWFFLIMGSNFKILFVIVSMI